MTPPDTGTFIWALPSLSLRGMQSVRHEFSADQPAEHRDPALRELRIAGDRDIPPRLTGLVMTIGRLVEGPCSWGPSDTVDQAAVVQSRARRP